ncbi:hypothetical protein BDV40DRAFT_264513 [Aspergillus tamarii]|uniref:Uncharacterized protein n=1 Tax=Aspergillus tamarii TaxID=41984 RepID=A0A5N6UVL0_ASPTM|nr:hypothetical protein BDV40DRAFT_264513 [Aspergillus tamarii]
MCIHGSTYLIPSTMYVILDSSASSFLSTGVLLLSFNLLFFFLSLFKGMLLPLSSL